MQQNKGLILHGPTLSQIQKAKETYFPLQKNEEKGFKLFILFFNLFMRVLFCFFSLIMGFHFSIMISFYVPDCNISM